jgi:tRNA-dihydrouridine synthase
MLLSLAPMEGLTGHVFRKVHAECFGALDRYYTPFLPPPRVNSSFGRRSRREIDPERNRGLDVVPQLLTKNADEFVWAAHLLAEMGYREVNLNLGCPSKTVTTKGKGAGFLRNLDELEAFLQDVCAKSPIPVSVKTRIGIADEAEYGAVLDVFCRCPLKELIVHPRLLQDGYRGRPRWEAYGETLARAPFPVAYNGDIFGTGDADALVRAFPQTRHVMLGRGVLANPALPRMIAGGRPAARDELICFHDRLFSAYEDEIGGNAVQRMKEWWSYAKFAFTDPTSIHRSIRKVRKIDEYQVTVRRIFEQEELADFALFR